MIPETIGERIKAARKANRLSQEALSDALGIKRPAVTQWEANKTQPNFKYLDRIAATLHVSTQYLLSGENDAGDGDGLTLVEVGRNLGLPAVPEIRWRDASTWPRVDDARPIKRPTWNCPLPCSAATFVLRVDAGSMYTPFEDGSLLFVDPQVEASHGKLVVVLLEPESPPVIRRYLVEGSKRYLEALNPAWPERFVPLPSDARLLGTVIFSGRVE